MLRFTPSELGPVLEPSGTDPVRNQDELNGQREDRDGPYLLTCLKRTRGHRPEQRNKFGPSRYFREGWDSMLRGMKA